MGSGEKSKEMAKRFLKADPDHYRKLALKSQEAWIKGGRKPRGFSVRRDLAIKGGKTSKRKRG